MNESSSAFKVYKTDAMIIETIRKNIIRMLSRRKYINEMNELVPLMSYKMYSKTPLNSETNSLALTANNQEKYAIHISLDTLSSTKQPAVLEFINEYTDHRKIMVFKSFTARIAEKTFKPYNVQIFSVNQVIIDLMKTPYQSKFYQLTPAEMEDVRTSYNITPYTAKKMFLHDPVAQYYDLKPGDIILIERPSPTSGIAFDYRMIVV